MGKEEMTLLLIIAGLVICAIILGSQAGKFFADRDKHARMMMNDEMRKKRRNKENE